jgi:hypothetical protein
VGHFANAAVEAINEIESASIIAFFKIVVPLQIVGKGALHTVLINIQTSQT